MRRVSTFQARVIGRHVRAFGVVCCLRQLISPCSRPKEVSMASGLVWYSNMITRPGTRI